MNKIELAKALMNATNVWKVISVIDLLTETPTDNINDYNETLVKALSLLK